MRAPLFGLPFDFAFVRTYRVRTFVFAGFVLAAVTISGPLVRLAAVPLLFFGIWWGLQAPRRGAGRWSAWILLLAIVLLPAIQLIPLPPVLWVRLPGRDFVAQTWQVLGQPLPWMPISLAPAATEEALLSMLPALAVFVGAMGFDGRERRVLLLAFIAGACLNAFLGLAQVAGSFNIRSLGHVSAYGGTSVAFFNNKNHLAALLYASIPFAAALLGRSRALPPREMLRGVVSYLLVILILLLGLGAATSRSGFALGGLACLGALPLILSGSETTRWRYLNVLILAAIGFAVLLTLQVSFGGLVRRFAVDPLGDLRFFFFRYGWEALLQVLPVGTGFGGTGPYFLMNQTPETTLLVYVDYLHNDWLQAALEGGVPAVALMLAFLVWYAVRVGAIWFGPAEEGGTILAKAAAIAIALLLVHAVVEFHLRSVGIMCLFAFACVLLMPVPDPTAVAEAPKRGASRPGSRIRSAGVPARRLGPGRA